MAFEDLYFMKCKGVEESMLSWSSTKNHDNLAFNAKINRKSLTYFEKDSSKFNHIQQ